MHIYIQLFIYQPLILFSLLWRITHFKAMVELVESGGMEWNEVGYIHISLFGFVKNKWNEIECDGTHSI
jgi:hypothetical protein